jgi:hypothetical protein
MMKSVSFRGSPATGKPTIARELLRPADIV